MNYIYHFGDSYGRTSEGPEYITKHFVHICADIIGYGYEPNSHGGISNEMIFGNILKNLSMYKPNDIIFINWSFFQRASFWDDVHKKIRSTNVLYNEMENIISDDKWEDSIIKNILPMLDYYLKNSKDYNMRLFYLINLLLLHVEKQNVKIFHIFADNSDFDNELLFCGTNLKFNNGFARWLRENDLHKHQDLHYSSGVQPAIANMILNKTNNLTIDKKYVHLTIEDFDKTLITKKQKLL